MNTRKDVLYDKHAAGNRIRASRKSIGLSRAQMAELIGKSEKYYADIERGYCGMSLETMIEISRRLGFSLDYLVNGEETAGMTENARKILFYLGQCDEKQQKKAEESSRDSAGACERIGEFKRAASGRPFSWGK